VVILPRARILVTAALIAAAGSVPAAAEPAAASPARPVLVELFTSQGCSSCPPADRLLGELAARDDVLALSFNITYWDYLGWRDTLGREEHTARQEAYAVRFRDRKYTPQMVIDGTTHVPGNRGAAVRAAIDARRGAAPARPAVTFEPRGGGLHLDAPAAGAGTATVWLIRYDTRHEVEISRGENAGETVAYANVVRDIAALAEWDMASPLALDIPAQAMRADGHDGAAVVVQQDGVGPVIAVARLPVADRDE